MTPSSQGQARTQACRHGHHRYRSGIGGRLLGHRPYRRFARYLLRDGRLSRITCDHSYVQHLINTGRITPSEAKNHPQRNVVMRVLGDFDIDPRPDISIRRAHPADRWLLCSDGLCGVLEDSTIEETMTTLSDQGECAQRLVQMALRAAAPIMSRPLLRMPRWRWMPVRSICRTKRRWSAVPPAVILSRLRHRQRAGGYRAHCGRMIPPAQRARSIDSARQRARGGDRANHGQTVVHTRGAAVHRPRGDR